MKDFEKMSNKEFAYSCLNLLKDNGCLNEKEIYTLTSEDQCRRLFAFSKFSVLSEVPVKGPLEDSDCYDDKGKQRFYKDIIHVDGRAFVVSNHWYRPNMSMPDNRTPFLKWVLQKVK